MQAVLRPRIYPTFRGFLGFDYQVIFNGGLDGGLDGSLDRQFGHITQANLRLSKVLA